ncbi:HES2 isoform 5 [Pongo abelii]|uniref:HES2 isoform 5 n=1 Tax=Pongo abelii TaxID=9601 RepID=A0A2J8URX0_PONAB|nr:HES2 isoform 5 [Pongo abelii]
MGLPRRAGDAAELRKSLKPLLEKRRRARINQSLSQLKGLILPLLGRECLATATARATAPVWRAWPACCPPAESWSPP